MVQRPRLTHVPPVSRFAITARPPFAPLLAPATVTTVALDVAEAGASR